MKVPRAFCGTLIYRFHKISGTCLTGSTQKWNLRSHVPLAQREPVVFCNLHKWIVKKKLKYRHLTLAGYARGICQWLMAVCTIHVTPHDYTFVLPFNMYIGQFNKDGTYVRSAIIAILLLPLYLSDFTVVDWCLNETSALEPLFAVLE